MPDEAEHRSSPLSSLSVRCFSFRICCVCRFWHSCFVLPPTRHHHSGDPASLDLSRATPKKAPNEIHRHIIALCSHCSMPTQETAIRLPRRMNHKDVWKGTGPRSATMGTLRCAKGPTNAPDPSWGRQNRTDKRTVGRGHDYKRQAGRMWRE